MTDFLRPSDSRFGILCHAASKCDTTGLLKIPAHSNDLCFRLASVGKGGILAKTPTNRLLICLLLFVIICLTGAAESTNFKRLQLKISTQTPA